MNFLFRVLRLGVFCLCIVGTTWLGGCARQAGGGSPVVERNGNKVVIDFLERLHRAGRQDHGKDGSSNFKLKTPTSKYGCRSFRWGTYYDKLTLSLAYGGAPEVFIMHAARLPEFASFDTLKPLDSFFATARPPLQSNQFAPVPWHATFYKGRQLALPLDVHPIGLYYNTKLFEQAGIVDEHGKAKPPRTLQEFLDDARKITKDTNKDGRPDQWGFVFTNQRSNWADVRGTVRREHSFAGFENLRD